MLIFRGNVSPKNITKQIKRTSLIVGLSVISVCFIGVLILLVWSLVDGGNFEETRGAMIAGGVSCLLGIFVIFIPTRMIDTSRGRATTIEIDKTRVRCESPYHALPFVEISMYEVKKVIDYGECYFIIYTDVAQAIVCQKDLIKEGTLEEFEALFAGKIKRRCRKK